MKYLPANLALFYICPIWIWVFTSGWASKDEIFQWLHQEYFSSWLFKKCWNVFPCLTNRHQVSVLSFFLHHVKCLKLFWGSVKLNLIIMQRSVLGCLSFEQPNTFNSKRKKRKPHDDFQESKVKLFFLSSQNKLSCWFEKN